MAKKIVYAQKNIKTKNKNNTSGVTGVFYDNSNKKWRATITVNYKKIRLGYFTEFEKAVEARKNAENFYSLSKLKDIKFKIPYFYLQCILKVNPNENKVLYEKAIQGFFNAIVHHKNDKTSFFFFACEFIKNFINGKCENCYEFTNDDMEVDEIFLDWINGMSYSEIANKYNYSKSTTDRMIRAKKENFIKKVVDKGNCYMI